MTTPSGSTNQPTPTSSTSSSSSDLSGELMGPADGFTYSGPSTSTLQGMQDWLNEKASYLAESNPSQAPQLQQAASQLFQSYQNSFISFFFYQFKVSQDSQQQAWQAQKDLYGS